MQKIGSNIIKIAKKIRIKKLEEDLKGEIYYRNNGEIFICPFCKYQSKKNRKGTAKIFKNENSSAMKCFACGIWRRI